MAKSISGMRVRVFVQPVRSVVLLLSMASLAVVLLASPASAAGAVDTAGPCEHDTELGRTAECVIVCLALDAVRKVTSVGVPENLVCGTW